MTKPPNYVPSESGDPAPGQLELVRALVNSRERDPDIEELETPAALAAWLRRRGVAMSEAEQLTDADLERARAFRETVRDLLLEKDGDGPTPRTVGALRDAAESAPLRAEVGSDGTVTPATACSGVDALVARVLATIAVAQETGEWERLKVCRSGECLWAFYDRSRNRSRHWCSMEVCGNRAKTRAYRAKRPGR